MKAEDCPEPDTCYKIKMISDKGLLDWQYAEAIRAVCAKCDGKIQEKGVMPIEEDETKTNLKK